MTGKELQEIRRALCGIDTVTFGKLICVGERFSRKSPRAAGAIKRHEAVLAQAVRDLETREYVPGWFARIATMYAEDPKLVEKWKERIE